MSLLLLIGGALAVLGVALLVQGIQNQAPKARLSGAAGILAGAALAFLSYAFVVIPAGSVGVVFNVFGGVQDRELGEGFHIVLPVLQQVTVYDVRQQEITLSTSMGDQINARSSEGLDIGVDVTVLYQVVADEAARLHQDIGPSYVNIRLRPQIRTAVRDGIAEYNAANLISSQRMELQRNIELALSESLASDNLRILGVLLRDVRIPTLITDAIEEKQAAEQQVEVEENRRRQSEIAAQRRVIEAEGERDATIARAEGEAQALELRAEALRGNPDLIQLEFAQRLAPTVQTIMLPTDGNFLLDVRQLAGGGN
jgi:regulator of protease activity HflC (stomatin/prohibitin superfamily)